jgi:hypothetical protein
MLSAMGERMSGQLPVLQSRRSQVIDDQKVDEVRRMLWRAFQHGGLTEEEFASTLERLEFSTSRTAESRRGALVGQTPS